MDDLELLKQDWDKNSDAFKTYNQKDLFKMIKKNSVSISKTLLIIGLIEVVLWFALLYLDQRGNEPFFNLKTMIRTAMFVSFIGALAYYYAKINSECNSKKLIKSILSLRRLILIYVGLIFLSIFVFTLIEAKEDTADMVRGWIDGYNEASLNRGQPKATASDFSPGVAYFFYAISMIVFFIVLYFIYNRVYGGLLEKLKANYYELTKLEESDA